MDGYALRPADIRAATPDRPIALRVIGEVQAGYPPPSSVVTGTALRIMTGAMLPEGADAIVRVEETQERDHQVEIRVAVEAGPSVRHPGTDLRAGDRVARAGQVVTPGLVGVIASAGRATVRCVRRPRVLLLSTGDELRPAGEPLGPGQITNTNRYTLRAAIEDAHGVVVDAGVAKDDRLALAAALAGASTVDLVLTTGGGSMGSYDLVRRLLEGRARMDFWQGAPPPGKAPAVGPR